MLTVKMVIFTRLSKVAPLEARNGLQVFKDLLYLDPHVALTDQLTLFIAGHLPGNIKSFPGSHEMGVSGGLSGTRGIDPFNLHLLKAWQGNASPLYVSTDTRKADDRIKPKLIKSN